MVSWSVTGSSIMSGLIALGAVAGVAVMGIAASATWNVVRPNRLNRLASWRPIPNDQLEAVQFTTTDGLVIRGWFAAPATDAPVVLLFHGFGTNRHEVEDMAPWMSEAGYGVLLFDFRAHGESDGTFSTVAADGELADARAAVAYVMKRCGPNTPLAVIGISRGGSVALRIVGEYPTIKALVTDCAFATMQSVLNHSFEQWFNLPPGLFRLPVILFAQLITGVKMGELRPIDDVSSITPRAHLLIHNTEDQIVNPADGVRIEEQSGPGLDVWRPVGRHCAGRYDDPDAYRARVLSTLARGFMVG